MPKNGQNSGYGEHDISASLIEQIMRSNPAASAYQVAVKDVRVWIHAALVSKRGQRRRILERFLNAPERKLTSGDLVEIAHQYNARVKELRDSGFIIPNFPTANGGTFFQLLVTDEQAQQIRCALLVADRIKRPGTGLAPEEKETREPAQSGFGFGPVKDPGSFVEHERGERR